MAGVSGAGPLRYKSGRGSMHCRAGAWRARGRRRPITNTSRQIQRRVCTGAGSIQILRLCRGDLAQSPGRLQKGPFHRKLRQERSSLLGGCLLGLLEKPGTTGLCRSGVWLGGSCFGLGRAGGFRPAALDCIYLLDVRKGGGGSRLRSQTAERPQPRVLGRGAVSEQLVWRVLQKSQQVCYIPGPGIWEACSVAIMASAAISSAPTVSPATKESRMFANSQNVMPKPRCDPNPPKRSAYKVNTGRRAVSSARVVGTGSEGASLLRACWLTCRRKEPDLAASCS